MKSSRRISNQHHSMIATVFVRLASMALLVLSIAATGMSMDLASSNQMETVCHNFLAQSVAVRGSWAGSTSPSVSEVGEISANGVLLARYYNLLPDGFVVVPTMMDLPPVKMYSETSAMSASDTDGPVQMLRDLLYDRYTYLLDNQQTASPSAYREQWNSLVVPTKDFRPDQSLSVEEAGPLLTSSWHQNSPYNLNCPTGMSGRSVVGCVATAASQILNFWKWPAQGFGNHTYLWSGDNSCSGTPTAPQLLYADFSDTYDWANIRDSCDDGLGCNATQQAALAELCYEVGVAVEMDYGSCGSGASQAQGLKTLPLNLKYDWSLENVCRKDYDLAGWFAIIQQEVNAGRPIWYGIHSHMIVADGWRTDGITYEFHMNYGWGQSNNAWYVLDHLSCSWVSGGICPASMEAMVIHLQPENSSFMTYLGALTASLTDDGDGYADPGETVGLRAVVRNLGWDVTNATVTVSTTDPFLSVSAPNANFKSTLTRGQWDTAGTPVAIDLASDCPDPHLALLTMHVQEDGGFSGDYPLVLRIGNTRGFEDDAEAGPGAWLHRPVTERFADEWHLETYQRHGGTSSWKCGGLGAVNYADASDGGLVTPPIRLAPNSKLSFWHLMSAECGSTPSSAWDGGVLMISDDGVEWTKIYPELGYTHSTAGTGSNLNFDGSDGLFSGTGDWGEAVFNLTAWSNSEVRLMFRFDSDGAMTVGGWYVDDLWIGNTDEGLNVKVKAAEGLDITFSIAGGRGNTWADVKTTGPALPPLYSPVALPTPTFFYPVTTAPVMNSIGVSITYEESQLQGPEDDLVLMAHYDGTWHDVTTGRLVNENKITGAVDALCPLVLAERLTCCAGRVGDANGTGTFPNEVTISDIQLLVTAKFISSLPCEQNLSCLAEADVNQSGGANPQCSDVTIADIQTLVNHLFIAGPVNAPLNDCL